MRLSGFGPFVGGWAADGSLRLVVGFAAEEVKGWGDGAVLSRRMAKVGMGPRQGSCSSVMWPDEGKGAVWPSSSLVARKASSQRRQSRP